MKRLILSISMMVFALLASAQNDDWKQKEDSIRQVMKERMLRWEKNRAIYKRMYEEDPYATIDSVQQAERIENEQLGIDRFEKLTNLEYITADIESPLAKVKMDIQDIPFEENTFDLILSALPFLCFIPAQ